jgi:hypothetical protein
MEGEDRVIQCLVAAVQAVLTGDSVVEDGALRVPEETLGSHDGQAVQVDSDSEPGILIFRLVPYPPEEATDGAG